MMPEALPRLRANLDFMPSAAAERPGLLIRDPCRYTDVVLVIPPPLIACLECFDGQHTELDLRAMLVRITGDLQVADLARRLIETLSSNGCLEDDNFARLKEERQRQFAGALRREPAHSGLAYPAEPAALEAAMARYLDSLRAQQDGLCGIAAPHVSLEAGWRSYQAAYHAMSPHYKDRVFVVLGTSHYGEPERFGLTRKPYVTPLGETATESKLADWLAQKAPQSIQMEDYCHSVEHSIEFQVLFLQYLYGPRVRILPILCGPYAHSICVGGKPEQEDKVRRFLDALGELAAREGDRLFWVLGIDMAHMGRRYGDPFPARAEQGIMAEVVARDRHRIACLEQGDAAAFWGLVQQNQDDLKWCGSAPLYTFMASVPGVRANLLRYEQWNIDEHSVVSFAGLCFVKSAPAGSC